MLHGPLNVIFPTGLLKSTASLLDPENTETVWEYYLLENLSCGLIRDSKTAPLGYEGCLAESFYQEDPQTWVFLLRRLTWSDGTEVTFDEINSWISTLRAKTHRHIRFLPQVKTVKFDEANRTLRLTFPFPMDNSILHELSLADSGLMPTAYKTTGWGRTIGPFFVESWDSFLGVLTLAANPFSPIARKEMPQKAILKNVKSLEQKNQLFKQIPMDIVPATALTDPDLLQVYRKNSSQQLNAHPSSILFLHFNYLNLDAQNFDFRRKIANAIEMLRPQIESLTSLEFPLHAETQLVPLGFNGRLDSFLPYASDRKEKSLTARLDQTTSGIGLPSIRIRLPMGLKVFPKLVSAFSQCLLENDLFVTFDFNDEPNQPQNEIGRVYGFVGNQLDSSGSWSFLLGPPSGPLSQWLPQFKRDFDLVFTATSWIKRREASELLHKALLKNAIAIPFMIGQHRYFLSARVDASRWNPFDSRLRLYELGWQ